MKRIDRLDQLGRQRPGPGIEILGELPPDRGRIEELGLLMAGNTAEARRLSPA